MNVTYREFKEINDRIKPLNTNGKVTGISKDFPMGKVVAVKGDMCQLAVYDNVSTITIQQLVEDILYNEMGCISNPSSIRNWKGWKH